jgi:hypothetical protein
VPASFRVSVRAQSIQQAISLARGSYPGAEASLVLPVEPELFFAGDDFDGAEQDTFQRPQRLVGCERQYARSKPVEALASARKKRYRVGEPSLAGIQATPSSRS